MPKYFVPNRCATIPLVAGTVESHRNPKLAPNKKALILVAGVNIKRIDNIVFASPSKSRIRNLQSIGRGLRKVEGKTKMRLFDIADDLGCENYTLNHLKDRINIYNEEGFNYEIKQFELK